MPRWRFFGGELVPVEVTLQNVGKTPLVYEDSCPPPGSLVLLEGTDTAFPAIGVLGCGALGETILAPGRTVTAEQFVVLPSLAGAARVTAYLATPMRSDLSRLTPSLLLPIGLRPPAGHRLRLVPRPGHRVDVQPQPAHLRYYYSLFCDGGKLGSALGGSGGWQSLPEGSLLTRPSCNADGQPWSTMVGAPPGGGTPTRIVWSMLVGAPGYAVASGTYQMGRRSGYRCRPLHRAEGTGPTCLHQAADRVDH